MCGICGYIGYENAFNYGFLSIVRLLNRGYDSVGVTTIENTQNYNYFLTHKYASDSNQMADVKIIKHQNEHSGTLSIFHSRWAVCGGKTDINSHPHTDYYNKFSLVHNGIIENYVELKKFLMKKDYKFKSETDTEVIANLISYYYNDNHDPINAIRMAIQNLDGTYALAILCVDTPDCLYCIRHGSPLLVGFSKNDTFSMIVSECYGFDRKIKRYFCLDNHDIIQLTKEDDKVVMKSFGNKLYENIKLDLSEEVQTPEPYPHWTIKEINEQSTSCIYATGMGGRICDDYSVKLGGLEQYHNLLENIDNVIFLGCGTSYNACLLSSIIFKDLCKFNIVQVFDGGEFSMKDIPKCGKSCFIFVSQSGETKDLHRCIELLNEYRNSGHNLTTIGVINVVDSLIAREVDCGVYLNCGRENGVASTKAFSSQVIVLTLIAIWFAQNDCETKEKRKIYLDKIKRLQNDIITTIDQNTEICQKVAQYLLNQNSIFILGKNTFEPIAREGSLKIKEIGYIHAEGYSSSALKHGPYALLDDGFPVVLITPHDEYFMRNQSTLDELKARGAYVIGISDTELSDKYDVKIKISKNSFSEITSIIPLQLIAYYLSVLKNIDPDRPRHLAKTVTVF